MFFIENVYIILFATHLSTFVDNVDFMVGRKMVDHQERSRSRGPGRSAHAGSLRRVAANTHPHAPSP